MANKKTMCLGVFPRGITFCGAIPTCFMRVFTLLLLQHSLSSSGNTESSRLFSQSMSGDLNIGYLVSIHEMSPKTGKCDLLRSNNVVSFESFSMAIEEINGRTDLLPNISIGYVAMDDCHNDITAMKMSVLMMRNSFAPHSRCTSDILNHCEPSAERQNVKGVVGLSSSRVAVMVAPYFGVFQIPTLSLYATSDELSDKTRYEYFSRVIPPDRFHEHILLQIARKMGWTYLSLVYSEGSYGENAAAQISSLLRSSFDNICLAVSIKMPSDATDDDFEKAARQLAANSHARVALTFIQLEDQRRFYDAVRRSISPDRRILWLGSDAFGEMQNAPYADVIEGGIYTDSPSSVVPGLVRHVSALNPRRNKWFSMMWEQIFQCRLESGMNDSIPGGYASICHLNQSFPVEIPGIDWRWPMTARAYDAAYVFAHALDGLIRNECPEAINDKSRLKNCISGQRLLQYVRNVTFEGVTGKIRFDSEGNLIGDLLIKQYQRISDNCYVGDSCYVSMTVGIWNSSSDVINLNTDKTKWTSFYTNSTENASGVLESVCSKPCQQNEFAVQQDNKCCWTCVRCRSNEIVGINGTACKPCPKFYWPDDNNVTTCIKILPEHLLLNRFLSLTLFFLAFVGCSVSLAVSFVYCMKRKHRRIKATSIELSLIILTGTVLASVTVMLFIAEPRQELCIVRSIGFHAAINILYGPLLFKNIRTYRIFKSAERSTKKPPGVGTLSQMTFVLVLTAIQVWISLINKFLNIGAINIAAINPFK